MVERLTRPGQCTTLPSELVMMPIQAQLEMMGVELVLMTW
jgi:hypothetical protein